MLSKTLWIRVFPLLILTSCASSEAQCTNYTATVAGFLKSKFCQDHQCTDNELYPIEQNGQTLSQGFALPFKNDSLVSPSEFWITSSKGSNRISSISYLFWDYYGYLSKTDEVKLSEIYKTAFGNSFTSQQGQFIRKSVLNSYQKGSFKLDIFKVTCSGYKITVSASHSRSKDTYSPRRIKGLDGDPEKTVYPVYININVIKQK